MIDIPAHVTRQFDSELRHGTLYHKLQEQASCAQREADSIAKSRVQYRSMNGLGSLTTRVPADAFHFWGQKLGYQCWSDKAFLREYRRDNPGLAMKSGGTKMQFGYGAQLTLRDTPKRPAKYVRSFA